MRENIMAATTTLTQRVSALGLLLASVICAQDTPPNVLPPILQPDIPIALALAPSDPSLPGKGPSKALLCEITPSGPLTTAFFFAESSSLDLFLRVEDAQTGKLLAEDDNSGGGKTPFLQIELREPRRLRVIVASTLPDQAGVAIANLRLAHETKETLSAPEIAKSALADADSRSASGDHDGARKFVRDAVQHLLDIDGATTSHKLPDALWSLGLRAHGLGEFHTAQDAQAATLASRSRTLPDNHPDQQRARLNLASTIGTLGDLNSAKALQEKVLEVFSRTLPDDHPDLQMAWQNLAATLSALGDLNSAKTLQKKVLEARSRTLPDDHPDLQTARGNLAITIHTLGDFISAKALQEEVLEVFSRTLPGDHPLLQATRLNLSATLMSLGDLTSAKALQERVLEVSYHTLPDDHPHLQMARGNLANTLFKLGDLNSAKALQEKVLEIRSRTLTDDHPDLQAARHSLASTLYSFGDLVSARVVQEKVLEVFSRTLTDDHPNLQAARGNLAVTLRALGDLNSAKALQEKVLEIRSRTLTDDHPDLQAARHGLASTLYTLGDLISARVVQEKVLEVSSRTLPDEHPDLQAARGNLAVTLRALGELKSAKALQEKVLEVRSRTLPDDHPDLQAARDGLASTLLRVGDLNSAKALQEKVLEVKSRTLRDDHPELQAARGNLAVTNGALGDLNSAKTLQAKVLEVRSRTLPDDHPDLQAARGNLAATLKILGDLNGARTLQEKVLEICSRTLPDDHTILQAARLNLASTLSTLGEPNSAKAFEEKVLKVRSRALSDEHPHLQASRQNLAITFARLSDRRLAAILRAYLQGARQQGRACFGVLTSIQTLAALAASEPAMGTIFGLARLDDEGRVELVRDSASTVLSRRQAALSGQRLLQIIALASGADRQRIEYARVRREEASARLSRVTTAGETDDPKFDAVRGERDAAERAFSNAVRSLPGAAELLSDVSIETLLAALRPEQAVVIFFRYTPCTRDAVKQILTWHPPRYAAFVGRPEQELAWINLGDEDAVRDRLETWLGQIAVGYGDSAHDAGSKLFDLLIAPLMAKIGSAREWLVLADGDLHRLPLDALPEVEGVVGDHHRVVLVSDIRELLRTAPAASAEAPTFVGLGDVEYDDQPLSEQAAPFRGAAADEKDQTHFGSLDSTGPEIEEISEVFKKAWGDDAKVRLLKERRASRRALEIFGPKTKFLHLATHGYFEPLKVPSRAASGFLDSQLGFGVRSSLTSEVHALSPFTLCGIALAGANLPPNVVHRIEGRMTGAEIADIDLTHCELAVISACHTAKGAGDLGPAIASFQTALHAAGARSAITALWRVPDAPTKELMVDFYRNLWLAKMSKAEALWRAKCNLREAKNKDGTPKYNLRDWAAWVLTGDPR